MFRVTLALLVVLFGLTACEKDDDLERTATRVQAVAVATQAAEEATNRAADESAAELERRALQAPATDPDQGSLAK